MERVADYVIGKVQREGADHIFLVTGRGILYLTDAVARNKEIQGVSTFHEQGASFAAMAYAQINETLGACLVSTGCAAANAVTAALCAWQDSVPCIFISGQHMLAETTEYTGLPIRTYGSQEANVVDMVKSITKYAVMLTDPKKAVYEVERAIYEAKAGRKGPVWIDIPLDVQNMRIEPEMCQHFIKPAISDDGWEISTYEKIRKTAQELGNAERPVILIGSGVRWAGASEILKEFVERNRIPIVYTASSADIYGLKNELSIGAVGSLGGSRSGNFAVQNADYLLVLGSRLCSQTTGNEFEKFAREAQIVVVDIDEAEHKKKGVNIAREINADVKRFLLQLNQEFVHGNYEKWVQKCKHWKKIFNIKNELFVQNLLSEDRLDLYYFSQILSEKITEDVVIITDAGLEELIVPSTIGLRQGQRCILPASQGAMGYALPAVLGAYYAGRKNICVIVGDGSVMMNIQELQYISSEHIPAKIMVINNNMYAVIRKRQKDLFRTRTIGNDPSDGLPSPDFRKLSVGFGIDYMKIEKASELSEKLDNLMKMTGPILCEIMCTEEQNYLHSSFTVNKNRRVVRRPIEDMSPFLDRETFLSEMLVEPIDQ